MVLFNESPMERGCPVFGNSQLETSGWKLWRETRAIFSRSFVRCRAGPEAGPEA